MAPPSQSRNSEGWNARRGKIVLYGPENRLCEWAACGRKFTAHRLNQRYCHPDCQQAARRFDHNHARPLLAPLIDWHRCRGRKTEADKVLAGQALAYITGVVHDARWRLAGLAADRKDVAAALAECEDRSFNPALKAQTMQRMGLDAMAIAAALGLSVRQVPHLLSLGDHALAAEEIADTHHARAI